VATAINDSGPRAEALAGLAPYLTVGEGAVALGDSWAGWSADLTARQIVTASSSKGVRSW
jgi:hypothetical protein